MIQAHAELQLATDCAERVVKDLWRRQGIYTRAPYSVVRPDDANVQVRVNKVLDGIRKAQDIVKDAGGELEGF